MPPRSGRLCVLPLMLWLLGFAVAKAEPVVEPPIPPGVEKFAPGGPEGEPFLAEPPEGESSERIELERAPRLIARFRDGFAVATEDDEFELRIRIMEQTDFKLFLPDPQEPARSGVYIPRFRSYFEGHVTESFEYELSLQRSVEGTFDVLDANINFRPSEEFQIRIGRFIVPYSYDWYDHLEQYFITPERGLFPLNFGLSREAGAMVWGSVNEGALQYALGAFSGQLSGLADTNTSRDGVAYLNFRPFRNNGEEDYGHWNIGGSLAVGDQAFPTAPLPLRTSLQASENDEAAQAASSVFLEFNEDVVLSGARNQAALHLAWYRGPLSFESEAQVGRFDYATPHETTRVPVAGYHLTTGYFVTGEEVTGRGLVKPLRPFNPARGIWGPGALEPFARYSRLTLGKSVFESNLADERDWTRQLSLVDVGLNWYPNRFVKFYLDWQISLYDTPVLINRETDEHVRQNYLVWLRAQIFF